GWLPVEVLPRHFRRGRVPVERVRGTPGRGLAEDVHGERTARAGGVPVFGAARRLHGTGGSVLRICNQTPAAKGGGVTMARGINRVILIGNLGNDPETKHTQGGMAVTTIRLATTSVRKDRDGNTQERTEWHRVKFFGKLAKIADDYLRKGSQVYIEGSIRYDKFTSQNGQERYITEIIANEMQ